jgi:hypothetical protein
MGRWSLIDGGLSGSLRHCGKGVGLRRGSRRWHDWRGKKGGGRRWPARFKGEGGVPRQARWWGGPRLDEPGGGGGGGGVRTIDSGAAHERRWVALGDALKQGREGEADWWGLAAQYRSAGPNLSQNGLNNLNSKLKPVQTLTHPKRIFP